jgi:hypothetical protein
VKKYKYCANCDTELGEIFYMFMDNFLQVRFFDEQDGSDNAFCSMACAAEALMLEGMENVKDILSEDDMKELVGEYEYDEEFPCNKCSMKNDCCNEHTDKRIECQAVEWFLKDKEGGK